MCHNTYAQPSKTPTEVRLSLHYTHTRRLGYRLSNKTTHETTTPHCLLHSIVQCRNRVAFSAQTRGTPQNHHAVLSTISPEGSPFEAFFLGESNAQRAGEDLRQLFRGLRKQPIDRRHDNNQRNTATRRTKSGCAGRAKTTGVVITRRHTTVPCSYLRCA